MCNADSKNEDLEPLDAPVIQALVSNHRRFLNFIARRVGDEAVAEEILQSAFVKTIEKGATLRDDESAVAWFYRLLRNAIIDHYRGRDAERRALEKEAKEPLPETPDPDMRNEICGCMRELLPTLKPEYAAIVRAIDLEDKSIADVAAAEGISANNATVRLHRGRQALRRQLERSCGTCATHGCLDCSCGRPASVPRS